MEVAGFTGLGRHFAGINMDSIDADHIEVEERDLSQDEVSVLAAYDRSLPAGR